MKGGDSSRLSLTSELLSRSPSEPGVTVGVRLSVAFQVGEDGVSAGAGAWAGNGIGVTGQEERSWVKGKGKGQVRDHRSWAMGKG